MNQDIIVDGKHVATIILHTWFRLGVNESKHLLWSKGGVPCVDAAAWDAHKHLVDFIFIRTTKGRRFRITKDDFETHKKTVDFGYGKQYYVDRERWDIADHYGQGRTSEQLTLAEIKEPEPDYPPMEEYGLDNKGEVL